MAAACFQLPDTLQVFAATATTALNSHGMPGNATTQTYTNRALLVYTQQRPTSRQRAPGMQIHERAADVLRQRHDALAVQVYGGVVDDGVQAVRQVLRDHDQVGRQHAGAQELNHVGVAQVLRRRGTKR